MAQLAARFQVEELSGSRIRDLSDDGFRDRYGCDRFTAMVLANRFRYVVAHMSNQFRWHAFSTYIRDAADLVGVMSGPPALGYPMVAVSETLPLFYGSMPDAVRIVMNEYGADRLVPGDMILVNDYYRVGTHFNDACCIRPVFHQGEIVGTVNIRAHNLDMGGWVFGGWEITSRNTYQNGLRLPPILLYSAGKPVDSTIKLLYDNTRVGDLIVPDLETEYYALELAERMLQESIDKYGLEAYWGTIQYVCDASDEAMRNALQEIPNGVYEADEILERDGLPDSPEYRVRVRIVKVGERAEFDFRGSSHATRSALNCTWLDVKTAIAMALKLLIDPKNPMTSGTLRSIDAVVPPDALFNPSPPHACQFYHMVVMTMVHAIFRALNPVLGSQGVGPGYVADMMTRASSRAYDFAPEIAGSGWVSVAGPWGGTKEADGDSGQQPVYMNLNINGGVETSEAMYPKALVLHTEYEADTAGPGLHRGGASSLHETVALADNGMDPIFATPVGGGGVYGGRAGTLTRTRKIQLDANGEGPKTNGRPSVQGSVNQILTTGGAGWGDPCNRDPERVKADVRDGYVTVAGAARDYGVVITGDPVRDPEGIAVDDAATGELRETMRSARNVSDLGPLPVPDHLEAETPFAELLRK